ncbi:hypothetical protein C8R47DRAFT_1259941 [Mycena vitilis]|nr:hypothetical protein C8R47DRAFT_1259941 [Mycena vitilis]
MDSDSAQEPSIPELFPVGMKPSKDYFFEDGNIFLRSAAAGSTVIYSVWKSALFRRTGFFNDLKALPEPVPAPAPAPPAAPASAPAAAPASTLAPVTPAEPVPAPTAVPVPVPDAASDTIMDLNSSEAPTSVEILPSDETSSIPLQPTEGDKAAEVLEIATETKAEEPNGQTLFTALILQPTEAEIEVLLECIYLQNGAEKLQAQTTDFFLTALAMGEFFSAPILTEMGTKWLSTHQVLHPTMRISLAIRFHVPQWIEPAFRTLTRTPLRSLTVAQINELGFSPYIILAETQAKIAEHRTFCALTVPPVIHGSHCPDPPSCNKSFAHAWWGESVKHGIAVAMIHPARMPAKKIVSSLSDLITTL